MPLAFSFFSSKNSAQPSPAGSQFIGAHPIDESPAPPNKKTPSSPFPVNSPFPGGSPLIPQDEPISTEHTDIDETVLLTKPPPLPLPERRPSTGGLAAIALTQSEIAAPPLNKRLSLLPGTTASSEPAKPADSTSQPYLSPPPLADVEALRQELQSEIEQVKNDLFGAVMGVSALKDRLDGIESQVQPPAADEPAFPSRNELEAWMSTWLETRLGEVLERSLAPVLTKFSTQGLLRLPISPAELNSTLSQPPVIITSTPV